MGKRRVRRGLSMLVGGGRTRREVFRIELVDGRRGVGDLRQVSFRPLPEVIPPNTISSLQLY